MPLRMNLVKSNRPAFAAGCALLLAVSLGRIPLAAGPAQALTQDKVVIDLADGRAWTAVDAAALGRAFRSLASAPPATVAVKIDYPAPGTLFPPDMVAPTALFHDPDPAARLWLVEIAIDGENGHIFVLTDGRRTAPEIDPRAGTHADEFQEPEYARTAKAWTPSPEIWALLTSRPGREVSVTIRGLVGIEGASGPAALLKGLRPVTSGALSLRVSTDPVAAPILYRDVPLMPTANDQGVIKPLADGALPLIEWRLRDLSKPASIVVMKNLPTCANCHSFSKDGSVLGLDMDGPNGDKGAYAVAPVSQRMVITGSQVMSWNAADPTRGTYGLFSRVSPDGRYVVSTIRESLFVQNYLDFRFLQTFYPTRGILAVYDRDMDKITPLPGADLPGFVQTNAVWTPDGGRIIFLRAPAMDNVPPNGKPTRANDPNEIQIKYDLYSIPFAGGKGGTAEPLRGASANDASNSFPAVSPDGKWLVWVQAAAGLLMRPDSALYIMPINGGRPRRLNCNLFPMNSWHSWSPNSRWMVFSSKANTPYTQLFLTHIDEEGKDSPAVLIPHSTASNRAANLPEFAAIAPDGIQSIQAPAVEYKRHVDRGLELIKARRLDEAFDELKAAEEEKPDYPETLAGLGYYFREKGDLASAVLYFEKALAIEPRNWEARNIYGVTLFRQRNYDGALKQFEAAIAIDPINSLSLANSLANIAAVSLAKGDAAKARQFYEKSIAANPQYLQARTGLASLLVREGRYGEAAAQYEKYLEGAPADMDVISNLAWLYATCPADEARNGARALELARKLLGLARLPTARIFDITAAAFAETGRFTDAVDAARRALEMTPPQDAMAEERQALMELYKSGKPHHRKK
jgi:type IV pilus biogenesis/stability protein PilW